MSEIDYDRIEQIARAASNNANTARMSQIAKESSKEAVTEMLLVCGIDYSDPTAMQELMAYGKSCKNNAEYNKKAIDWVHDVMETGKVFKRSVVGELGKHCLTLAIGVSCAWIYFIGGIK